MSEAKTSYTTKQMGDACEMLVAAELTLAGIPALKMPDNWPHCDVMAQPRDRGPQLISVKSRTFKKGAAFVAYLNTDRFDWLAIVLLPAMDQLQRRFFIIPREAADASARQDSPTAKTANERYFRIDEVGKIFGRFENNFVLRQ
ncbi:MAG: hypothetical protein ACXWKC_14385 [Xanthobacteraceae bacterium]